MEWLIDQQERVLRAQGGTRYEVLAAALEDAIRSGRLPINTRLPSVRQMSKQLGISAATVSAAYDLLNRRGWTSGQVGRGTFVTEPQRHLLQAPKRAGDDDSQRPDPARGQVVGAFPWRRRAMGRSAARLRLLYPDAANCTGGGPDPSCLPTAILREAWKQAAESTAATDLQYATPEPVPALVGQVLPRLEGDGIQAAETDLVVGSSTQQLMTLALQVVRGARHSSEVVVAVEEPGYPAAMDTLERVGYRLVGIEVDRYGVVPASLERALSAGADATLLTPRAQNPTGASWSVDRLAEIADVLSMYPKVVAIEDDQFAGLCTARPGSLLSYPELANRVVYIRSFSKAIAPDLRIAMAVARPPLRVPLTDAKSFADGWTSRFTQRTLAHVLADQELDSVLDSACASYEQRRTLAASALSPALTSTGGRADRGTDGLNVWVHLPPGTDSGVVIEYAATLGVIATSGEPFFIRPGRHDLLRFSIGSVALEQVEGAAQSLAEAIASSANVLPTVISV